MTMLRARRLASAVVVASLAVGGLSACRSQPAVAVYIGNSAHITEHQVQRIWDETEDVLVKASNGRPVRMPIVRADIVGLLLTHELLERVAGERGVTVPGAMPYDEVAQQIGLPAGAELTRLYTENALTRQYLLESAASGTAAQPSDADLRDVYQRFTDNEVALPAYAQFAAGLEPAQKQELQSTFALRDDMEGVVDKLDVEVSPRYENLEVALANYTDQNTGRSFALVSVPFGEPGGEPLVVDVA
ncbi:hypothetical protein AMIS_7520 [Actinoplanes missouriensis 431]|uniref:Lipoprotein n=1 Tax=Actinoplanes missouriensis (strain ATCC 14538 / DSM 43046 / CBS 188.64 / JCM 3121 / NBRC 102363 / NCIMB 12654 / NRRL B-3342 / UNCC 431) TaxID=512565 RepID=I0GYY5_ACTM4|nr:hypothetical protein [Actinoplanes missouriensis]BAL85972.1 hypothetical protein AMIS_7520 [Actinoplanes missouriensis 431]